VIPRVPASARAALSRNSDVSPDVINQHALDARYNYRSILARARVHRMQSSARESFERRFVRIRERLSSARGEESSIESIVIESIFSHRRNICDADYGEKNNREQSRAVEREDRKRARRCASVIETPRDACIRVHND